MSGLEQFPVRCQDSCDLAIKLSDFDLAAAGIAVTRNCKGPEVCVGESEVVDVFKLETGIAQLSEAGFRDGREHLEVPAIACRNQGINLSLEALAGGPGHELN
jgi:hypothetical protein